MKNRILWLFGLTLLPCTLFLILIASQHRDDAQVTIIDASQSTTQSESGKRNYEVNLVSKNEFKYGGGTIDAWYESGGKLYIADQADQVIYAVDFQGHVLDTIGESGSAPWQNQHLRRFKINNEGIYSIDNSLMTLRFSKLNGESIFYKKQSEPFWDGVYLHGNKFLLVNDESVDFGFYGIDALSGKRNELLRIDKLLDIKESQNLNIAYEGEMVQGNDFHFYVCSRTGLFFTFDRNGRFHALGKTIDKTEVPSIKERKVGNMVVFERHPDELINYSATTGNEGLFILSLVAFESTDKLSIDVYHPDGYYIHSIEVPNNNGALPVNILKGSNSFFVLYENQNIVQYSFSSKPA